jgi:mono/diheme cytochrome c family protein
VLARAALAALAIAVVATGCGSSGGAPRPSGAALFTEDCGMCHSLTGRQSPRRQGGDLLALRMSRVEMLQFVREMPVPHPLTQAEVGAVADYVRSVETRAYFPGSRGRGP